MVLIRTLGWLLLALAVAAAIQDGLTWWSEGVFRLLALGDMWSHLDYDSLNSVESYLVARVSSRLWAWIILPILRLPALPVFLILGFVCLWIGQANGRRSEPRSIISSRRPRRRRRSSGLS